MNGPSAAERGTPQKFAAYSTRNEGLPEYSPDGTKVVFHSDRGGPINIWVCDSDGANAIQLTHEKTPNWAHVPRWSPNGDNIVLILIDERGVHDIHVVGSRGGFPRRLTKDEFVDNAPSWSPDGHWVYFLSNRSGDFQIWKIPAEGDQPIRVTRNGVLVPPRVR